jgi:ankyrin repeat protein
MAAELGRVAFVRQLFKRGASTDKNADASPLDYAIHSGAEPVVLELRNSGTVFDFNHLRHAVHHDWTQIINSRVVCTGIYSDAWDERRVETLLDLALRSGHSETAKLLIDSGVPSAGWLNAHSQHWIHDTHPDDWVAPEVEELPW